MNPLVQCPKCHAWLLDKVFNAPDTAPCPACGVPLQAEVFPALFRPIQTGPVSDPVVADEQAGCFYHPGKKAITHCEGCGRFLCALCDCQLPNGHFCASCIETGRSKGKMKNLEVQRTRYDSIALALSIYPLVIFYFTLVTAPVALWVAFRHWNTPTSIVRRTRVRFVIAIALSSIQIAGWALGIFLVVTHHT